MKPHVEPSATKNKYRRTERGAEYRCDAHRSPKHDFHERGAVSIEVVLIVPVIMLIVALMTAGWRLWSVRAQVSEAAAAGARAASVMRGSSAADVAARQAIDADLDAVSSICTSPAVSVDTTGFRSAVGSSADVNVEINCAVPFTDLLVPMPGSLTVTAQASSPIDSYKERQP